MVGNLISKSPQAIKALATRRVSIECDRIPYQFNKVPLKKIFNWIRVEASMYKKPESTWGWPTHIQIEPTTRCNLRCALCPLTTGMNRPAGNMDFEVFKKLIDEIGSYLFLILLWDWGEPFLNPSIYKMITYAKQHDIKIVSSTNGHPFTCIEHANNAIHSGLDTLIFAVDGISQETYSYYRKGGDLELVLQGIRTLIARKSVLNSKTPIINLRFIAMRHNEHEIPALKEFASSIGVDVLSIKTLNPYREHEPASDEHTINFLPENRRYHRFKIARDGKTRIRLKRNPCKSLWNSPSIHWNGTVCSCTLDYNEKHILGDLNIDTFKNIWSGKTYRSLRSKFRAHWENIDICTQCTYAYEGGNCSSETIADIFFLNQK